MTTQHTPAPWDLQTGEECCFHQGNRFAITKWGEENGEPWNVTIAEVWPADNGADEADARLIVAAPDLLAAALLACSVLEEHVEHDGDEPSAEAEALQALRDAIRKTQETRKP